MAAGTENGVLTNGTHDVSEPRQLSIGLPHFPGINIHAHLTVLATSVVLFLTSATVESGQGGAAMGSFVYAMPDVSNHKSIPTLHLLIPTQRYNAAQPLSTVLYSSGSSIDFATRMAKILARRTKKLCYVGSSINLSAAAGGGSVGEEMEATRAVADAITAEVTKAASMPQSG